MQQIKFLRDPPQNARVIMIDRSLLAKDSYLVIDDVAILLCGEDAIKPEGMPEPIKCMVGPAKEVPKPAPTPATQRLTPLDLVKLRVKCQASTIEWAKKVGLSSATVDRYERHEPINTSSIRTLEVKLKAKLDHTAFKRPDRVCEEDRRSMRHLRRELAHRLTGRARSLSDRLDAQFTF